MARSFNGTSDYLEHGAAVVTAVPITLACWYQVEGPSQVASLLSIGDSAASTCAQLFINQSQVLARTGTSFSAVVEFVPTRGGWGHACGVFASATDRRAFANGQKATNTANVALGTPTTTTIGARYLTGVRGSFMKGLIADAAIWNVALDDAEVSLLSRGYSPWLIRPGSLVAYWPLVGQFSPAEIDLKGRFDLTVNGAKPSITDHPVLLPRTQRHRAIRTAFFLRPLQYARPASDIAAGGWTASSGSDLFAMVDEVTPDDSDRIRSNTGALDDTVTLGLGPIATPVAGDVSIRLRHRAGS